MEILKNIRISALFFVLFLLSLFVSYSATITNLDYYCRNISMNITRNYTSNSSYIEILYYNNSGLTLITSFWLNGTKFYKWVNFTLPWDNVNSTVVVRETFERTKVVNDVPTINRTTEITSVILPYSNLTIIVKNTEGRELSGYNILLTIECLNNSTYTITNTTIFHYIIGKGKVWITSYPKYFEGRKLKNISKPIVFDLINTTEYLIFYYKTLLNRTIGYISINGENYTLPVELIIPYGFTPFSVYYKIISEDNITVTETLNISLIRYNSTTTEEIFNGSITSGYLNLTIIQDNRTYHYIGQVFESENYNFTNLPSFNVTVVNSSLMIISSSVPEYDFVNGTVTCSYISSVGWKKFIQETKIHKYILASGLYDPFICGSEFFNLSGISNLILIGENKDNVKIGGYYQAAFIELVSYSDYYKILSILRISNSTNITIRNVSFIVDNIKDKFRDDDWNYYEYLIYITNSNEINISDSEFYSLSSTQGEYQYGIFVNASNDIIITNNYFHNLSSGIISKYSFIVIVNSVMENLTEAIKLFSLIGNVTAKNIKIINCYRTVVPSEVVNYLSFYPVNVSVFINGTYYGKIIRIDNKSVIEVSNTTYNNGKIFKIIFINVSTVYINNSYFEKGYDKVIDIYGKELYLFNTTFDNSVIGISIYPNLVTFYANKIVYKTFQTLYLPNIKNIFIEESLFSVEYSPNVYIEYSTSTPANITIKNSYLINRMYVAESNLKLRVSGSDFSPVKIYLNNISLLSEHNTNLTTQIEFLPVSGDEIYNILLIVNSSRFNNSHYLLLFNGKLKSSEISIIESTITFTNYVIYFSSTSSICDVNYHLYKVKTYSTSTIIYLDSIYSSLYATDPNCASNFIINELYSSHTNKVMLLNNINNKITFKLLNSKFDTISNSIGEINNVYTSSILIIDNVSFNGYNFTTYGLKFSNSGTLNIINVTLYSFGKYIINATYNTELFINNLKIKNVSNIAIYSVETNKLIIDNVFIGNSTFNYCLYLVKFNNSLLKDLKFVNVSFNNSGKLIYMKNFSNTKIYNIYINGFGDYGIYTIGSYNVSIDNVVFEPKENQYITNGIYCAAGRLLSISNISAERLIYHGIELIGITMFSIKNIDIYNFGKEYYMSGVYYSEPIYINGSIINLSGSIDGKIENIFINYSDLTGISLYQANSITIKNIIALNFCKNISGKYPVTCGELININQSSTIEIYNIEATDILRELIKILSSSSITVENISVKNVGKEYITDAVINGNTNYLYNLLSPVLVKNYEIGRLVKPPYNAIKIVTSENVNIKNFKIYDVGLNGTSIEGGCYNIKLYNGVFVLNTNSSIPDKDLSDGIFAISSGNINVNNVTILNASKFGIFLLYLYGVNEINNTKISTSISKINGIEIKSSNPTVLYINNSIIYKLNNSIGINIQKSSNIYINNDKLEEINYLAINIYNSTSIAIKHSIIKNIYSGIKINASGKLSLYNLTIIACEEIGIWIVSLLDVLKIGLITFINTTYPIFLDSEVRPPTKYVDLNLIKQIGDIYVDNLFNGNRYNGYILFIANVPSFSVNNNLLVFPKLNKKIYALYIYNSSGEILNSEFNYNGNLIYILNSTNIHIQYTTLNNSLHALDLYYSSEISLEDSSILNPLIYGIFGKNVTDLELNRIVYDTIKASHLINAVNIFINNSKFNNVNETIRIEKGKNININNSIFTNIGKFLPKQWSLTKEIKYSIKYIDLDNITNATLFNDTFIGNKSYPSVEMYLVTNILVKRCKFETSLQGLLIGRSYYGLIIDSKFIKNIEGVKLWNPYFYYNSEKYDIRSYFKDYGTKYITIDNCEFKNNINGTKIEGSSYINVLSSIFESNVNGIAIIARKWGHSICYCCYYSCMTCNYYWYQPSSNISIKNCYFGNSTSNGIYIDFYTFDTNVECNYPCQNRNYRYPDLINNISIENSIFINNTNGINANYNKLLRVNFSSFELNNIAISLLSTIDNYLFYSKVINNTKGINGHYVTNLYINSSTIDWNEKGIYINISSGTYKIINSSVSYNNNTGIDIFGDSINSFVIMSSKILSNKGYGICGRFLNISELIVKDSNISLNDGDAIYLHKVLTFSLIFNSTILKNNGTGYFVDVSNGILNISYTNISFNNNYGILLNQGHIQIAKFYVLNIKNNSNDAINTSNVIINNLTSNKLFILNNGGYGLINYNNIGLVNILNSKIINNNKSGIEIRNITADIYVRNVTSSYNKGYGIYLHISNDINNTKISEIICENDKSHCLEINGRGINNLLIDYIYANNNTGSGLILKNIYTIQGKVSNVSIIGSEINSYPGIYVSTNNVSFKNILVYKCAGDGIDIIKSKNISFENVNVTKNGIYGVNITMSDNISFNLTTVKNNTAIGVIIIYSDVRINNSNITWNGGWGLSVYVLKSYQKVIVNNTFLCYNTNGASYDVENIDYDSNFLAVINSWFGGTNPENPYLTFLVANKYMNAYPDNNYFCNYTKRGLVETVSSTPLSGVDVSIIPYLPRANTYIISVKGNNFGAVVLSKEIYFEPIVQYPIFYGSGKYIIIVKDRKVYVA